MGTTPPITTNNPQNTRPTKPDQTRAPSWGDISFIGTRLSTHRRRRGPGNQNHIRRRCGGRRRDRRARAGFEAGPGCGAHGRWRGLAGLRDRPLRAVRLACGDLAGGPPPTGAPSSPAPQQDQTAPGTPAEPQTQTQQSGPEPLGSGPPSMPSGDQQRATRVSSARPPCRPCRSSRR